MGFTGFYEVSISKFVGYYGFIFVGKSINYK